MKGTLLKILSVLAFSAVVFPFIFGCDINTYGNISIPRILFYYGIGAVMFLLGYLDSAVTKSHKKLRIPMRILGILTFGAGFLSLLIDGDGVTVFALGVCCVFWFFIGERAGFKNFADMYPLTAFAVYIVLAIACYIFVRVAANDEINEAASDAVVTAFAAEFAAAALLVNQSGIFDRANMRKETKASLPRSLTAYNAALVLGFTVTGLALCVFRKQLAWLLEQAAIAIMRFLLWLSELFSAEYMEIEQGGSGEIGISYTISEDEPYLLEIFVVVALIALAVIFRRKLLDAVKGFFARLGAIFSGRPEESVHPEFTDVFEDYSSEKRRRPLSDNIYAVRRKYLAESDPGRKFRYGYRIILFRIKAVNDRLSPSDTVSVQTERGAERFGEGLRGVAGAYACVRYGNAVPTAQQLEELQALVEMK